MGLPDLESAIFPNVMQLHSPVLLAEATLSSAPYTSPAAKGL